MSFTETFAAHLAKRHSYKEPSVLPFQSRADVESVTVDLAPSSWYLHPSSVEMTCIKHPMDRCLIEADIVSLPKDRKFVDEEVEGIFYTYEDEVYYPCHVSSVHSYPSINEVHNHVVCVVHGKNRALKTLDELIETSKKAEDRLKRLQAECARRGGVWTEKHVCKIISK